jgi:hypothetical protein
MSNNMDDHSATPSIHIYIYIHIYAYAGVQRMSVTCKVHLLKSLCVRPPHDGARNQLDNSTPASSPTLWASRMRATTAGTIRTWKATKRGACSLHLGVRSRTSHAHHHPNTYIYIYILDTEFTQNRHRPYDSHHEWSQWAACVCVCVVCVQGE